MEYNQEKKSLNYKSILLELLTEFIRICEKNNLQYFCIGGTLIGAVRHQGLIPWDDDIDVAMPRDDYDRFIQIVTKDLKSEYKLLIPTPLNSYNLPFAKLYNIHTTVLESLEVPNVMGVYIDIFPLDGNTTEKSTKDYLYKKYSFYRNQLHISSKSKNGNLKGLFFHLKKLKLRTVLFEGLSLVNKRVCRQFLINKLNAISLTHPYNSSKVVGLYSGSWGDKEFWDKACFKNYKLVNFEGLKVRIPIGYDSILRSVYGDYMQLPPVEKRVTHHKIAYLNLEKNVSYNEIMKNINY